MDEYYVEQIVAKQPNMKDSVIKALSIGLSAALIVSGLIVYGSAMMISLGVIGAGLCFYLLPRLNVEFEYLYLEKELTVDRIFNKEKRKKAGNYPLDKMEMMAPVNSHSLDQYNSRSPKVFDYTSGDSNAKVFAIIINDNGCKKVLIEPDEKLLRAIKDHFPRKVVEY